MELVILKLFIKDKTNYSRYRKYISNLDKEIYTILHTIDKYYEDYDSHNYLSTDELKTFFFHLNPAVKDKEVYENLFAQIDSLDISDSVCTDVVRRFIERNYASKIIEKMIPIISQEKFSILHTVQEELDHYRELVQLKEADSNFVEDELEELLDKEILSDGLSWRLACLNSDIGSLRGGSLGHVFARVDTGKTTFLASEISEFARQIKEDEHIVWFNNEEKGSKVKLRLYSAVLGAPLSAVTANVDLAKEKFRQRGGDRIRLYDSAYISEQDIRRICRELNPRMVVIDQGDKISYRGSGETSEVDRLKQLYRKFREIAKEFNVDILTAGQASAEAHGKKWLELVHMDNSKTGKPGELDYAIGIGTNPQEGSEEMRYIHVCKNKMKEGHHGKHTCLIDAPRARYQDA